MATLAPNTDRFPADENRIEAIKAYMENTFLVAKNLNLPIIDVYHQSQDLLGNGLLDYIDPKDYIHPSTTGHQFIAKRIVEALVKNQILE